MSLSERRKLNNFVVFSFLWILLLTPQSWATSVKSKLQLGAGGYDETLTGEGDFIDGSHAKKTDDWFWSMDVEFSQVPSTSTTTGSATPNVIDHSYTYLPETGFEMGNGLGTVFNYTYSYTPEENLVDSGPELDFYYYFYLEEPHFIEDKPKSKDKGADFKPTMKIKIGGKDIEYVQTFNGTTKPGKDGQTSPTTGFNNLRQIGALEEVTISPWSLITAGVTFTYYFYDRNVGDFLNYIGTPTALRLGAGGFSSSITDFAQSTIDATLSIYPAEKWTIDLELINSVSALDLSLGWDYEITLSRTLGDWTVGLGVERDTSPLIGNFNYVTFVLAYDL
jgi:hypothetical protein